MALEGHDGKKYQLVATKGGDTLSSFQTHNAVGVRLVMLWAFLLGVSCIMGDDPKSTGTEHELSIHPSPRRHTPAPLPIAQIHLVLLYLSESSICVLIN